MLYWIMFERLVKAKQNVLTKKSECTICMSALVGYHRQMGADSWLILVFCQNGTMKPAMIRYGLHICSSKSPGSTTLLKP